MQFSIFFFNYSWIYLFKIPFLYHQHEWSCNFLLAILCDYFNAHCLGFHAYILYLSFVNPILIPLPFVQPYVELANTYGNGKIAELEAFVKTNAEKFESVGSFTYLILIYRGILTVAQYIV